MKQSSPALAAPLADRNPLSLRHALGYVRDLVSWHARVRADADRLQRRIDLTIRQQDARIAALSAEIESHRRFLDLTHTLQDYTLWRIRQPQELERV